MADHTLDAKGRRGICFQALWRNFLATVDAIAVFPFFQPLQGGVNAQQFNLAPSLSLLGHGLNLQGVDPGKPTDRGLVKLHWLAVAHRCLGERFDFFTFRQQAGFYLFIIYHGGPKFSTFS